MTTENITFKKITPSDWEKFREIRLKALQTDPQAFGGVFEIESKLDEASWKNKFSVANRHYYAAEVDGIFVSTAGVKDTGNNNWMLIAVYTAPEFRGRNISQDLTEVVMKDAKILGAKTISLMVNIDQKIALIMYKKNGFKIIRIEKDQKLGDGKLHDEYYMEKN